VQGYDGIVGFEAAVARMPKHLRLVLGCGLLVVGAILALPLVPGPGIALMALGLLILRRDLPWAHRLLEWSKQKWEAVRAKCARPTSGDPGNPA